MIATPDPEPGNVRVARKTYRRVVERSSLPGGLERVRAAGGIPDGFTEPMTIARSYPLTSDFRKAIYALTWTIFKAGASDRYSSANSPWTPWVESGAIQAW